MRRTRLVWFAIGAAASAFAVTVTAFALNFEGLVLDDRTISIMVIKEPQSPGTFASERENSHEDFVASNAAKLLRGCGAKVFEVTVMRADRSPTADYPIVEENIPSIGCVISRVRDEGFEFEVENRWSMWAVEEVRREE